MPDVTPAVPSCGAASTDGRTDVTEPISRRRALRLLGAAGLGTVVLGACRADDPAVDASGASGAADRTTASAGSSASSSTTAASSGGAGVTVPASAFEGAAACTVTVAQTEGPYYIDVDKIRRDITEGKPGTPLRVAARVVDTDGCTPIKDAVFEIWHCDAGGLYSGFEAASTGRGGPGGGRGPTDQTRYLRGAQVTDAEGVAVIDTIYPGWYPGRTVHIHAKVILSNRDLLTTQLYFDDATSDAVFRSKVYKRGARVRNADDGIYRRETTLTLKEQGDGYLGLMTIGVRPTSSPSASRSAAD